MKIRVPFTLSEAAADKLVGQRVTLLGEEEIGTVEAVRVYDDGLEVDVLVDAGFEQLLTVEPSWRVA